MSLIGDIKDEHFDELVNGFKATIESALEMAIFAQEVDENVIYQVKNRGQEEAYRYTLLMIERHFKNKY